MTWDSHPSSLYDIVRASQRYCMSQWLIIIKSYQISGKQSPQKQQKPIISQSGCSCGGKTPCSLRLSSWQAPSLCVFTLPAEKPAFATRLLSKLLNSWLVLAIMTVMTSCFLIGVFPFAHLCSKWDRLGGIPGIRHICHRQTRTDAWSAVVLWCTQLLLRQFTSRTRLLSGGKPDQPRGLSPMTSCCRMSW